MTDNVRFNRLLEPGHIGAVRTRNRIIKTGAGNLYAKDWCVTEEHKVLYEAIAKGGVGLLIVEHVDCHYPLGEDCLDGTTLRLDEDRFIPGLSEIAQVIHKHNCPTFIQLMHYGPWHDSYKTGLQSVSASVLTESEMPSKEVPDWKYVPCRELTHADIEEIVDKFARGAERASKAGFDGVEINAGAGHLINAFLSRIFNKRQDKYGVANLENRARFLVEIVTAIKKRMGQDFPVSTIINGTEFGHSKGTTIEEAKVFAKMLEAAGAEAIEVRGFGYGEYTQMMWPENVFYPERPKKMEKPLDGSHHGAGLMVPLAVTIKKVVSVPIIAVGRLDPVLGEKILSQGKADFIGMTRRLLADPELPNKVADGRLDDIAPCTACVHCLAPPTHCRINAAVGSNHEYAIKPAEKKKKVLVVGGGPAGMEAARVSAIRGHEVILYEKHYELGGLVPLAAMVKGLEIEDLPALVRYLKRQITKLGVKINLNKEFKPEMIEEIKPDAVILATGGVTTSLNIPGLKRRNVIILSSLDKILRPFLKLFGAGLVRWSTNIYMPGGKRIVVIGGTFYGCELAEFLIKRGKKVTIVEMAPYMGEGMPIVRKWLLLDWFSEKEVGMLNEVKYNEITGKGLVVTTKDGQIYTVEVDTVMPSTFLKANTDLLKALQGKVPEIYTVGDCREPHLIIDAIADGYRVARTL